MGVAFMNQTVMVVDDNSEQCEIVASMLADEGYAPICCADGAVALGLLRAGAAPCLILLDLTMPIMDGWQFREAQHADPRFSDIPVVLMTASRKLDGIAVDGVMFKPLDSDQLLFTVKRHCQPPRH